MKTLKLNAVVGRQMDDEDGSSLGMLLDTDEGECLIIAEPAVMLDAAGKMHLAAKQSLKLQNKEGENISVLAPTAEIKSVAVTEVLSNPPRSLLAVSVVLDGSGIPLSFCFSQEDIDLMAAALAMSAKPMRHQ